ncbi:MAG TPA: S1 RNA-binding domain-containing protein [Planktothrix sp.]
MKSVIKNIASASNFNVNGGQGANKPELTDEEIFGTATVDTTSEFARLFAESEKTPMPTNGQDQLVIGTYEGHGFVSYGRKYDGQLVEGELETANLVVGQKYHFLIVQQGLEDLVGSNTKVKGGSQFAQLSMFKGETRSAINHAYELNSVLTGKFKKISRKRNEKVSGAYVTLGEGLGKLDCFMPCTALVDTHGTDEFRANLLESFMESTDKGLDLKILSAEQGDRPVVGHPLALNRVKEVEQPDGSKKSVKIRDQKELFERVQIGQTYSGAVRNVADYGVFVDLGGISGLLHKSEVVGEDLSQFFTGKFVVVTVIKKSDGKIGLSVKRQEQAKFFAQLQVGAVLEGVVRNTAPTFGAFVTVHKGLRIDGLLHWREVDGMRPKVGDQVRVRVLGFDEKAGRISLSLRNVAPTSPAEGGNSQS